MIEKIHGGELRELRKDICRGLDLSQSTLLPDRFRARSSALLRLGQRYTERNSWLIGNACNRGTRQIE